MGAWTGAEKEKLVQLGEASYTVSPPTPAPGSSHMAWFISAPSHLREWKRLSPCSCYPEALLLHCSKRHIIRFTPSKSVFSVPSISFHPPKNTVKLASFIEHLNKCFIYLVHLVLTIILCGRYYYYYFCFKDGRLKIKFQSYIVCGRTNEYLKLSLLI